MRPRPTVDRSACVVEDLAQLAREGFGLPRIGVPVTAIDGAYDDVLIRDVQDADVEVFFEDQLDPDAARMAVSSVRARKPFFALWAEIRAAHTMLAQTIVVNGDVAGNVMCWEQWGQRQVGYAIGRRYWGRGVATTALALFCCQVGERPLHASVAVHNAGSIRVLEKCGFRCVDVPDDHRPVGEIVLVEYVLKQ